MKARITAWSKYTVTVSRDNVLTGEREATTYFVPHGGGYVRVRDEAGRFPQVCEALAPLGNTLEATPETLLAVIRRELRKATKIASKL